MTNCFTIDIDGVLTAGDYVPGQPYPPPWEERLRPGMWWVLDQLQQYCGLYAVALTARHTTMQPDTRAWLQHTKLYPDLIQECLHVPWDEKHKWSKRCRAIAHIDDHPKVLMTYYAAGSSCLPIHFDPRGRSASLIPEVVSSPYEMMERLIRLHDEVRRGQRPVR